MKYRTKPVEVEAVQWTGTNEEEVSALLGGRALNHNAEGIGTIRVHVPYGIIRAMQGDWIIKGADGKYLPPCKPDVFEATYEAVTQ